MEHRHKQMALYSERMMKKFNKLAHAKTPHEKRQIAHDELAKVKPHKFKRGNIDVEIVSVGHEGELLKVIAKAWRGGVEVSVDNPLFYKNAPMLVPDGTFETVTDAITGKPRQEANFHEDANEALRSIVLETLKVTALKSA